LTLLEQTIVLILSHLLEKQVTTSTLELAKELKNFIETSQKCNLEYFLDSIERTSFSKVESSDNEMKDI
jgi:hypothetical protein